jgi:hypothetical protein
VLGTSAASKIELRVGSVCLGQGDSMRRLGRLTIAGFAVCGAVCAATPRMACTADDFEFF